VYLPDVQVQIERVGGAVVFSGATDLSGELSLPDLDEGSYEVKCSTVPGAPLGRCGSIVAGAATPFTFTIDRTPFPSCDDPAAARRCAQPPPVRPRGAERRRRLRHGKASSSACRARPACS
jgi:hypothetical protein